MGPNENTGAALEADRDELYGGVQEEPTAEEEEEEVEQNEPEEEEAKD